MYAVRGGGAYWSVRNKQPAEKESGGKENGVSGCGESERLRASWSASSAFACWSPLPFILPLPSLSFSLYT